MPTPPSRTWVRSADAERGLDEWVVSHFKDITINDMCCHNCYTSLWKCDAYVFIWFTILQHCYITVSFAAQLCCWYIISHQTARFLASNDTSGIPLDIPCTAWPPGLEQQQCVWTSTGKSPSDKKHQTVLKQSRLTHSLRYLCLSVTAVQKVSFIHTCAERLFLFRLFSFLLRRTPVSLERPKPLLTLDSLDWVAGATASPRLMHFFSYTEQQGWAQRAENYQTYEKISFTMKSCGHSSLISNKKQKK